MYLCIPRWVPTSCMSLVVFLCACGVRTQVKPTEDQFYKSPYVRRCLQYDKEQMANQSQACWARLLKRILQEPEFKDNAKLSDADVTKIRENAHRSDDHSVKLQKELDACMKLPAQERDKRIQCYHDYKDKHGNELSRAQKFEIDNTIATLLRAKERAAGTIEATIERAGKLLGVQLSEEKDGVRVYAVVGGPGAQAQIREQGIIVSINDVMASDLESAERIAHLEACEDKPVKLLLRYGDIGSITFALVETKCGSQPAGKKLWEVVIPEETCTENGDGPEMRLGVSWCYVAKPGILEVEEVCADSPAAAAGVRPGQMYSMINGVSLLGKTYFQIGEIFKDFPKTAVNFTERSGALQSPAPLKGPSLDPSARLKCWKAIESTLDRGDLPVKK
jgi:C-terminal processing protease CtpA/Prc